MNVKLHTPSTLKAGSGMSSAKQFFLSLIATTVSIVLTFGTAAIIDHHKKEAAKREMVMMVISDFDKTIEILQKADSALCECRRVQLDLATHPEHFDSLRFVIPQEMTFIGDEFSETIEKIFTTSIETFNTIGDVNFVNEASSFYLARSKYKEIVLDKLKAELIETPVSQSLKSLMNISIPEYVFINKTFLLDMEESRDKCMVMMKISKDDMRKFNMQQRGELINPERGAIINQALKECDSCNAVINQAREKHLF